MNTYKCDKCGMNIDEPSHPVYTTEIQNGITQTMVGIYRKDNDSPTGMSEIHLCSQCRQGFEDWWSEDNGK